MRNFDFLSCFLLTWKIFILLWKCSVDVWFRSRKHHIFIQGVVCRNVCFDMPAVSLDSKCLNFQPMRHSHLINNRTFHWNRERIFLTWETHKNHDIRERLLWDVIRLIFRYERLSGEDIPVIIFFLWLKEILYRYMYISFNRRRVCSSNEQCAFKGKRKSSTYRKKYVL